MLLAYPVISLRLLSTVIAAVGALFIGNLSEITPPPFSALIFLWKHIKKVHPPQLCMVAVYRQKIPDRKPKQLVPVRISYNGFSRATIYNWNKGARISRQIYKNTWGPPTNHNALFQNTRRKGRKTWTRARKLYYAPKTAV